MDSQKKTNSLRRGAFAALASVALLGSTLAAAPAHAAPVDGELTVSVLGPGGESLGGSFYLIPEASDVYYDSEQVNGLAPTATLPAGGYGIIAMSPWGGFLCAGVSPCSITSMLTTSVPLTVTPVVQVPEAGKATYALQAPATATLTGTGFVGDPVALDFSAPMDELLSVYGLGLYGGIEHRWLRNGVEIPGATGTTYQAQTSDVGGTVASRLSWSVYMTAQFADSGIPVPPRTISGVAVAKRASKTTVQVFRKKIVAGRSTGVRVDVTSGTAAADGRVKLVLGKWKATKTLRNGSVRVALPKLKAGTYKIKATYVGTAAYNPSADTDKITVVKDRKK